MVALTEVVLPVFLVIGFGYLAVRMGWFSEGGVDGLMVFTQSFAIPCLLFRAISTLDLAAGFDPALLTAFYAGALIGFAAGIFGARLLFARPWEDCVAIGFCCLFSNSLLLGLPIAEKAYGADALGPNYAIVAIHSPFAYGVGITVMEAVRGRGGGASAGAIGATVARSMFRNPLVIAIALGFAVNLLAVPQPAIVAEGLDLMVRAALPAALFGLGGVLVRYRPEGDVRTIAFVCALSLVLHPAITWGLGRALSLSEGEFRSAVLTAAMAPGVNAYIFANLYGTAKRVAASSVLAGTAASLLTAAAWLALLG